MVAWMRHVLCLTAVCLVAFSNAEHYMARTNAHCVVYTDRWCDSFCSAAPQACPECCYESHDGDESSELMQYYANVALPECLVFRDAWCTSLCNLNVTSCPDCCVTTEPTTSAVTAIQFYAIDSATCAPYNDGWCTQTCNYPGAECPSCCVEDVEDVAGADMHVQACTNDQCAAYTDQWCTSVCNFEGGEACPACCNVTDCGLVVQLQGHLDVVVARVLTTLGGISLEQYESDSRIQEVLLDAVATLVQDDETSQIDVIGAGTSDMFDKRSAKSMDDSKRKMKKGPKMMMLKHNKNHDDVIVEYTVAKLVSTDTSQAVGQELVDLLETNTAGLLALVNAGLQPHGYLLYDVSSDAYVSAVPSTFTPIDNFVPTYTVLQTYPGRDVEDVHGLVVVFATSEGLVMAGSLGGLEFSATGGIHIHSGTSCDTHAEVGGHWYNSEAGIVDPWNTTYSSDEHGYTTYSGPFISAAALGYDPLSTPGQTIVVHSSDGTRVACGVLRHSPLPDFMAVVQGLSDCDGEPVTEGDLWNLGYTDDEDSVCESATVPGRANFECHEWGFEAGDCPYQSCMDMYTGNAVATTDSPDNPFSWVAASTDVRGCVCDIFTSLVDVPQAAVVIDVRMSETDEADVNPAVGRNLTGYLPCAVNIPKPSFLHMCSDDEISPLAGYDSRSALPGTCINAAIPGLLADAGLVGLPMDTKILVHCYSGTWTENVVRWLRDYGFTDVTNMGGWSATTMLKDCGAQCPVKAFAVLDTYPEYTGTAQVKGVFGVVASKAQIDFSSSLVGLESEVMGGIHIHAGTSCASHAEVLGHWYNPAETTVDPWNQKYQSDESGNAWYDGGMVTASALGYDPFTMVGQTVVVHDASGTRVACGKLVEYADDSMAVVPDLSDCGGGPVRESDMSSMLWNDALSPPRDLYTVSNCDSVYDGEAPDFMCPLFGYEFADCPTGKRPEVCDDWDDVAARLFGPGVTCPVAVGFCHHPFFGPVVRGVCPSTCLVCDQYCVNQDTMLTNFAAVNPGLDFPSTCDAGFNETSGLSAILVDGSVVVRNEIYVLGCPEEVTAYPKCPAPASCDAIPDQCRTPENVAGCCATPYGNSDCHVHCWPYAHCCDSTGIEPLDGGIIDFDEFKAQASLLFSGSPPVDDHTGSYATGGFSEINASTIDRFLRVDYDQPEISFIESEASYAGSYCNTSNNCNAQQFSLCPGMPVTTTQIRLWGDVDFEGVPGNATTLNVPSFTLRSFEADVDTCVDNDVRFSPALFSTIFDTATDSRGNTCADYTYDVTSCGDYDDANFNANAMCCACGGGTYHAEDDDEDDSLTDDVEESYYTLIFFDFLSDGWIGRPLPFEVASEGAHFVHSAFTNIPASEHKQATERLDWSSGTEVKAWWSPGNTDPTANSYTFAVFQHDFAFSDAEIAELRDFYSRLLGYRGLDSSGPFAPPTTRWTGLGRSAESPLVAVNWAHAYGSIGSKVGLSYEHTWSVPFAGGVPCVEGPGGVITGALGSHLTGELGMCQVADSVPAGNVDCNLAPIPPIVPLI